MNIKQKAIIKLDDRSFIEKIGNELKKNGKVKVVKFGIFTLKKMKARNGYNGLMKRPCIIPERYKVMFKPVNSFKQKICKPI